MKTALVTALMSGGQVLTFEVFVGDNAERLANDYVAEALALRALPGAEDNGVQQYEVDVREGRTSARTPATFDNWATTVSLETGAVLAETHRYYVESYDGAADRQPRSGGRTIQGNPIGEEMPPKSYYRAMVVYTYACCVNDEERRSAAARHRRLAEIVSTDYKRYQDTPPVHSVTLDQQ